MSRILPFYRYVFLLIFTLLTLCGHAAEPAGSFVRFRVDALPADKDEINVTAMIKIHRAPWNTKSFSLTPEPIRQPGHTPWVNLRELPGGANGSLILSVPKGARGATRFGLVQDEQACVREIGWDEPDGTKIIIEPSLLDVRTFRDQERRYYLHALELSRGQLFPLTRPPLLFANAWGLTTGGAAEYMLKSFRLLGLNCVDTRFEDTKDTAKYEALYGWGSQEGHYWPPSHMPYDEEKARRAYLDHYRNYFDTGSGKHYSPGMRVFQMADEPGEIGLKPEDAKVPFIAWLIRQGIKPALFGKKKWDDVNLLLGKASTPEERRLYYWSRRYQGMLTPKMFGLACEAFCQTAPSKTVRPFVALSGHSLYFPSRLPVDMFQLAQYQHMTPGISDWMASGGSWWWDSHQAVAFSVAPFNAGARRYGKDFGKPPISFPMMYCVWPNFFRAYTQIANQCKLISYYNYGPDYEATEGFWSNSDWSRSVVHHVNNRAAQVDDILGPGLIRPSRVAMLYSMSTEYWQPQESFVDKRATFLALSHDYCQPELVTEDQIAGGALAHYDALYVADQWVSSAAQKEIKAWVKHGGLLWACADALARDEYGESADLLDRMAGLKRTFGAAPTGSALQVEPVQGEAHFEQHNVPPNGRPATIVWKGARIRATYGDNTPAWQERQVKKGKVIYLSHRCGLSYSRRAGRKGAKALWPTSGRQLITQPLMDAGVERELVLSEPLMMAMPLSTESGTVIILYNLTIEAPENLHIRLREPKKPVNVQWFDDGMQLADLPFDYTDGRVIMTIPSLPGEGTMIVVRRKPAPADNRLETMRQAAERHLKATDWQALSAGAWFSGFFPDWKLASKLEPLLKHEHWAVRRSAAESIGRLGYAPAARALREAVDREKDAHALADEIYALALLDHPDVPALCTALREHHDPFRRGEGERITKVLTSRVEK